MPDSITPEQQIARLEEENAAMRKVISSAHYALEQSAGRLRRVGGSLRHGTDLTRLASQTQEVARELEVFLPAYNNVNKQQVIR